MENYHVLYDFEETTISFNGFVLQDLPIEPEKRVSSTTMVIAIIAGVGAVMAASAIAIVCVIKKRNSKLEANLQSYNKLEEATASGISEIYQQP